MPFPFDPNSILRNLEQAGKNAADNEIDNLASKIPGGDQYAQQAKDAVNSGIDQAGQAGEQQAQQQAQQHLGGLGGMLGGNTGGNTGGSTGGTDNTGGSNQ